MNEKTAMKKKTKRIRGGLLIFALLLLLEGCGVLWTGGAQGPETPGGSVQKEDERKPDERKPDGSKPSADLPAEEETCYDLEGVVLYLDRYGKLPGNYISKNEARALGWEGGTVEDVLPGAAIGGDTFGNREGILPKDQKGRYYECDIDTKGKKNRGAKRLIYTKDGTYYYTDDHYESFRKVVIGEDGSVGFEGDLLQ